MAFPGKNRERLGWGLSRHPSSGGFQEKTGGLISGDDFGYLEIPTDTHFGYLADEINTFFFLSRTCLGGNEKSVAGETTGNHRALHRPPVIRFDRFP